MFTTEMCEKLLMDQYNPLRYYSHLTREDREFVNTVLIPKMKYSVDKKLTFPTEKLNDMSPNAPTYYKAIGPYLELQRRFKNEVVKICVVSSNGSEVCSDYHELIAAIPEEFHTKSILKTIGAICAIPFTGIESYGIIFEAYANLFAEMNIYEIHPVIRGLRETFKHLNGYIELKHSIFGIQIDNMIVEYLDALSDLDAYINGDMEVIKDYLSLTLIYVINFYMSTKEYTEEELLNTFIMKSVLLRCENKEVLKAKFHELYENYTTIKSGVDPSILPNRKVCEDIDIKFHPSRPINNTMSIQEEISYDAMKEITKDDISNALKETLGKDFGVNNIAIDINEEILAMFLVEYNQKYPIHLGSIMEDSKYCIKYEGKFYLLFQVIFEPDTLYAIASENIGEDENKITLLEFKKNPDYAYIFKY